MPILISVFFLFWLGVACSTSADQDAQDLPAFAATDLRDPLPGVVQIRIRDGDNPRGSGSGLALDDETVVTAQHLFELFGPGEAFVIVPGRGEVQATVIGDDWPFTDVAVLAVLSGRLVPIDFRDSGAVREGESAFTIGWIDDVWAESTGAVVDTQGRLVAGDSIFLRPVIVVTAPGSPGQSGGAVLDQRGGLVGLLVAADQSGSFAIPSNEVLAIARVIIACGCDFPRPDFGATDVVTIDELKPRRAELAGAGCRPQRHHSRVAV